MDAATLKEHLATLGVSEDCSDDALTEAYRDLVKVWHPDRFAHDGRLRLKAEEQLKLINHAYDSLRSYRREPSSARSRPSPDSSHASGSEQPRDVVFCANCGVSLRVPEQATYLRCPSCRHEQDRDGAPRPRRASPKPDDANVDGAAAPSPNHPYAGPFVIIMLGMFAVLLVFFVVSIVPTSTRDTVPTRVESTGSVEQAVDPPIDVRVQTGPGPNGAIARCANGDLVYVNSGANTCLGYGGVKERYITDATPASDVRVQTDLGPNGAIARCANGSLVYVNIGFNTCSGYGGVKEWYIAKP